MSDTLAMQGLEVPVLDDTTRAAIDRLIPAFGSSVNPTDLTAQAVRDVGYAKVAEILLDSPSVDIIVIVGLLTYPTTLKRDAEALGRLTRNADKPILLCAYTLVAPEAIEIGAEAGLPIFTSMPGCGNAICALVAYAQFQAQWHNRTALASADLEPALRATTRAALVAGGGTVGEHDAKLLLEPHGIPRTDEHVATDAEAAARAAERTGFPVALKIHAPALAHKTEVGGVRLGLADAAAVRTAFGELMLRVREAQPDLRIDGALVQKMARPGVEMVVGITRDPDFGPLLLVGLGGIQVEILHDVALAPAPAPIDEAEALRLLQGLRGYKVLEGVRGQLPADLDALCRLMAALSRFAAAFAAEVAEIDLNPVIVHARGEGLTVVDALIVRDRTATAV